MTSDLMVVAPMLIAVGAAVVAIVLDAVGTRRGVLVVTGVLLAGAAVQAASFSAARAPGWKAYEVLIAGGGYSAVVAVIMALAALALWGGWPWLLSSPKGGGVVALVAFSAGASAAMATSVDLIFTLIALETVAVCAYALVAATGTAASAEAAMKYAIQGAVATGLFLLGIAVVFGLYGTQLDLTAIGEGMAGASLAPVAAGFVLVFVAFLFKLGAVPFHSWAPDVFETAPPPAAAFMSAGPKIAAMSALFLIASRTFGAQISNAPVIVAIVAVASIVVGNFAGLRQRSYARMLGYSGVAQVGYALVGLGLGATFALEPSRADAMSSLYAVTMVLLVFYGVAAVAAFLSVGTVAVRRPAWDGSIAGMGGLGRTNPIIAAAIAVTMFSLTGIPLTAGFWGKLLVFGIAAQTGAWIWVAVVAVLGSVVSFGYYGRVLRSMYFDEPPAPDGADDPPVARSSAISASVLIALAVVLLLVGVVPLFAGVDVLWRVFVIG